MSTQLEERVQKLEELKMDDHTAKAVYDWIQIFGGVDGIRHQIDCAEDYMSWVSERITHLLDEAQKRVAEFEASCTTYRQYIENALNQVYEHSGTLHKEIAAGRNSYASLLNDEMKTIKADVSQSFEKMKEEVVIEVAKTLSALQRGGILVTRPAHPHEIREGVALPVRQASAEEVRQGFAHGHSA